MIMIVWILFCLFSSVGMVQCGFWLADAFKTPKNLRRGYHVIPLYDRADELEAQIRFGASQHNLPCRDGELVLLVDMGLEEECQQICEKLTQDMGGIYICAEKDLADTIRELDNLQKGANVVE